MRHLSTIDESDETQMHDDSSLSPMQATLHWISQTQTQSTSTNTAIVLAMEFSRDIIAVCSLYSRNGIFSEYLSKMSR